MLLAPLKLFSKTSIHFRRSGDLGGRWGRPYDTNANLTLHAKFQPPSFKTVEEVRGLLTVDVVRVVPTVLRLVEVDLLLLPHPHWRPPHPRHLPLLHHHFAKIRKNQNWDLIATQFHWGCSRKAWRIALKNSWLVKAGRERKMQTNCNFVTLIQSSLKVSWFLRRFSLLWLWLWRKPGEY